MNKGCFYVDTDNGRVFICHPTQSDFLTRYDQGVIASRFCAPTGHSERADGIFEDEIYVLMMAEVPDSPRTRQCLDHFGHEELSLEDGRVESLVDFWDFLKRTHFSPKEALLAS
jgi:hypothetical protein